MDDRCWILWAGSLGCGAGGARVRVAAYEVLVFIVTCVVVDKSLSLFGERMLEHVYRGCRSSWRELMLHLRRVVIRSSRILKMIMVINFC